MAWETFKDFASMTLLPISYKIWDRCCFFHDLLYLLKASPFDLEQIAQYAQNIYNLAVLDAGYSRKRTFGRSMCKELEPHSGFLYDHTGLLRLLHGGKNFQAADSRDQIYSMLGMIQPQQDKASFLKSSHTALQIRYDLSFHEVSSAVTKWLIEQNDDWGILRLCANQATAESTASHAILWPNLRWAGIRIMDDKVSSWEPGVVPKAILRMLWESPSVLTAHCRIYGVVKDFHNESTRISDEGTRTTPPIFRISKSSDMVSIEESKAILRPSINTYPHWRSRAQRILEAQIQNYNRFNGSIGIPSATISWLESLFIQENNMERFQHPRSSLDFSLDFSHKIEMLQTEYWTLRGPVEDGDILVNFGLQQFFVIIRLEKGDEIADPRPLYGLVGEATCWNHKGSIFTGDRGAALVSSNDSAVKEMASYPEHIVTIK